MELTIKLALHGVCSVTVYVQWNYKNWEQPSTQLTLSTAVKAGKEDISDFCPGQAHLKMRSGVAVGVVFSCECFTGLLKMVYTDFCFR